MTSLRKEMTTCTRKVFINEFLDLVVDYLLT